MIVKYILCSKYSKIREAMKSFHLDKTLNFLWAGVLAPPPSGHHWPGPSSWRGFHCHWSTPPLPRTLPLHNTLATHNNNGHFAQVARQTNTNIILFNSAGVLIMVQSLLIHFQFHQDKPLTWPGLQLIFSSSLPNTAPRPPAVLCGPVVLSGLFSDQTLHQTVFSYCGAKTKDGPWNDI